MSGGRARRHDQTRRPPGDSVPEGVALTELASGVRVVTEHMPDVRSVTIGMWVDCGSRDEREQVAGASHFLEHLLFKGTKRRSAQEIAATIDEVGGDMNAFTSKEFTCFYVRCLDRDVPIAVDVLGDMIAAARNRGADVEAERDVVLEEIRMHLDTPDDLVHSLFSESYFGEHPLGREVLGSEATISTMTRDQIHRYYRAHYRPDRLVVAAAGNVEHDVLVGLVETALEDLHTDPAGPLRRRRPAELTAPRTAVRARPTEQVHLLLGGPGVQRGDDRRFAASVLSQALGGGMASRLFQEVREQRGLVYSIYSYLGMHNDVGTFGIYAGTAPGKTMKVLDVVRAELAAVLEHGLTGAEVERAKGHLAGSMLLALEDTGSRMHRLGKSIVTGTPLLGLDETLAAVEAVTVEAVRDVSRLLLGGPFTLAVVGALEEQVREGLDRYVELVAA